MAAHLSTNSSVSDIAYFQIFRIYHDPAYTTDTRPLFSNSRQRIALTIEALARDRYGRKVPLGPQDLAAIRLQAVDDNGAPVGAAIPHDVNYWELSGWSTYSEPGDYRYDQNVIERWTGLHTATSRTPHSRTPDRDTTPIETDTLKIWVATGDMQNKTFAAKFHTFLSTEQDALQTTITLQPVRINQALVIFSYEEVLVDGNPTSYRSYNNYITAYLRNEKIPLKYIDMPGIWWDNGEEWKAEYSFCVSGHAGERQINKYRFRLPPYLVTFLPGYIVSPLDMLNPPDAIPRPRADEVVVLMHISHYHLWFSYDGKGRATDNLSYDGDITDFYGNVYPITFRYSQYYQPRRALALVKR